MSNTTVRCSTIDEIIANHHLPKIIVIGGGGLGKTSIVNMLTKSEFNTCRTSEDGTFNFQGASMNCNGKDILVVDSPGYRINEDRWWQGIMQIKNIIGVIIMHKYEHRNSGYGNIGYVLAYLNKEKNAKVKKFLFDQANVIESKNYMAGSDLVKSEALNEIYPNVQEWMRHLDESPINIISPIALIEQYQRSVEKVEQLEKSIVELNSRHAESIATKDRTIQDLETKIEIEKQEKLILGKSHEELVTVIEELPKKLALFDNNSQSYQPDAPDWAHHTYSWLPFAGINNLILLQKKAEKDQQIARELVDVLNKIKENNSHVQTSSSS
jgi:GTPase SAR1 family protein